MKRMKRYELKLLAKLRRELLEEYLEEQALKREEYAYKKLEKKRK